MGETIQSRSPKLKIKCRLFSLFLGKSILEKICLQQFQKVKLSTLPRSDWEFGGQNKTEFEVWHSFCDLVRCEWPIPIENHLAKADLSIRSPNCPSEFSQNRWKNNTCFWRNCQWIEETFLWVSPPNENRTGVFKRGTSRLSRTFQLVKTTEAFK